GGETGRTPRLFGRACRACRASTGIERVRCLVATWGGAYNCPVYGRENVSAGESEGMSPKPAPWTLTIASDLGLLSLARAFVEAVCQAAGCDEKTTHAVVLATDEATNNVMRHAHRGRPEAPIQIQCFLKPGEIEIRLLDEGAPFDLAAVPHLDPAELRVGG